MGKKCDLELAVQLISLSVSAKQLLVAVCRDNKPCALSPQPAVGTQLGVERGRNEETLHHIPTSYIMGKQSRNNSSAFLKKR